MNVLYILGNGFDKAQGMATSYPEFYEYLKGVQGSPLLEELKKDINADKKLWSDMEEAFGQFTKRIKTEQDFEDLYLELSDNLILYLKNEDERFNPTLDHRLKFQRDFKSYENYLGDTDKDPYSSFVNSVIDDSAFLHKRISVMTFNYTNTLEKLLDIGSIDKVSDSHAKLEQIIHVHGTLDDDNAIIMGVDNELQIANEFFRPNDNIKDFLVKNQSNLSMKYNRSKLCEDLIQKANVIILYGVSLGETDRRWWKMIGEQFNIRNDLLIIHFIYSTDASGRARKQLTGRTERQQKNKLMQKMGFINKEVWPDNTDERLFFVVNSTIFK